LSPIRRNPLARNLASEEALWRPQDIPGGVYVYYLGVGSAATGGKRQFVATQKLLLLKRG
jgi:hypothetical protein